MRVTTMDRYLPQPGRVVEFVPSPATLAVADTAVASTIPPSFNQRFHLRTADRAPGSPRHWLACAFDITGGPIDTGALRATFEEWVRRHETLRSGFRAAPEGPPGAERFVLPAEKVELVVGDAEEYVGPKEVRGRLARRLDETCRPLGWPTYFFSAILRPGGATVFCGFDHCNMDGYSLAIAVHEIRESYAVHAAGEIPAPDLLPETGSFVEYCAVEQERAAGPAPDRSDPVIARWGEFFAACGGTTPSFPLDLGVPAGERAPQGTDCRRLLDAEGAAEFERRCRAAGGNVFSGALTAVGLAARRLGGGEVVRLCTPLHTRYEERWENAVGWFTTVAPLTVDIGGAAGVAEGSPRTRAAFREALRLAERPVAQVLTALGGDVRRTRDDVFMVSYIDYRRFPGSESHLACNAHHVSSVTTADDAQFWVSRTHEGVFLRSRHPATPHAEQVVQSFADTMGELLAAGAGGAPVGI
ncbi:condensation domain-containing protein [Streptomyces halobius]|uniref:Condensation domain-containing protein n=1 Tax=Streptomyces halobius TaxID=2879846 RepID=A0ABY4M8S6_9ACTN|nr:condensation domain-containing protein [Streptomyces halobius]UQA94190.1 condensation domain-containing protein [Streptomyces halobius]